MNLKIAKKKLHLSKLNQNKELNISPIVKEKSNFLLGVIFVRLGNERIVLSKGNYKKLLTKIKR